MRLASFLSFLSIATAIGQSTAPLPSQPLHLPPSFIVGADVSFLRNMESKGAVFKDGRVPKPGLEILRSHGYNWVRLRIMNEPTPLPNTLAYTLAEAKAAKALGFRLLLDFHYSDDWADPAHEATPKAWAALSHQQLVQAVFEFTRDTVKAFRAQGTTPDMVQIGNEIIGGMLWPDGRLPGQWDNLADLLNAGVKGVRAGNGHSLFRHHRPAIMIHIDQGGNQQKTQWFFDNLIQHRVPFDVIGQSYYPWWQGSLEDLRGNLAFTASRYKKPIVLAETAWDWRTGENFKGKPQEFPQTPEGQREFLAAVAKLMIETPGGLGRGIFWWEPMAEGAIAKRGMFNDQLEALPALSVFDRR